MMTAPVKVCENSEFRIHLKDAHKPYCRRTVLVILACLLALILGYGLRYLLEQYINHSNAYKTSSFRFRGERIEKPKQRLPQCIVIGVRKCGTRALLEFLNLHPQIVAAQEEIHYFDNDHNYMKGLDWYRSRMPLSLSDQITIEKSPAYFITEKVPERIQAMNRSVKLVMIVRNPTTRTISDYAQVHQNKMARNKTHETFEDLAVDRQTGLVNLRLKAVRTSIYQRHLERWLTVFNIDQVLVLDGDNLIRQPIDELRRVEQFLGLSQVISADNIHFNKKKGFYCMRQNGVDRCLGSGKGRKHPRVRRDVIRTLNRFFTPHNEKLFQMTGVRFRWPKG